MASVPQKETFYDQLKAALRVLGVSRLDWARFVRWLRAPFHARLRIGGKETTAGRLILRAWRSEKRVTPERVGALATAIQGKLPRDDDQLGRLQCWRGHESGPRLVASKIPPRLATCRSTLDILRYHLSDDPAGVVARPETLAALEHTYRLTDEADQRCAMALWVRPLGKRAAPPPTCGTLPHPERFDLVWAFPWQAPYNKKSADLFRDLLGQVTFPRGAQLVAFHYPRAAAGAVALPTVVEALGGWAFVPAKPGKPQMTYNYCTGRPGAAEFVHVARAPPEECRFTWFGSLTREWNT